jgi:hypothetical protein
VCDEATGRAGQADDSIFVELPNGFNHGPLCESCHAEAMAHLEMWEKHATELAETITDREAKIAELTSAIEDAYREGWDDASQRPEDAITLEDLESDWRNSKASTTI